MKRAASTANCSFRSISALIEKRLDIAELNGPLDYRLQRMEGMPLYMTPR